MNDNNKIAIAKFIISLLKTTCIGLGVSGVMIIVYAYTIYPPKTTYHCPYSSYSQSITGKVWPKTIDDNALLCNGEDRFVGDYYSAYYNPVYEGDNYSHAHWASSYDYWGADVKVSDV